MKAIIRNPLQSEIIEYIKEYIEKNNLRSGDKLPSQAEMMEMIGVSRSSLREAIKTLEAKNILETLNGKGVYVKNISTNIISTQIEIGKEKESLHEILIARRTLEREILKLVIENATEEEVDNIGAIVSVIMEKYRNGQDQNAEDRAFHKAIYSSCHNNIMKQLIYSIESMLQKFWSYPLGMDDPFLDSIPLHEELSNAIKERNVKKAQEINDRILDIIWNDINSVQ